MSDPLALSTAASLALIAAVVIGLAFVSGLIVLTLRRGEQGPDIPPGMKPGPSDSVLERRHVERTMAWGILFVAIIALSVAWVWLREPDQNVDDAIELVSRAVDRGEDWFALFDAEENPLGFSCARCHGTEAQGGSVPFVNQDGEFTPNYPVPSLNDVCARLTIADPNEPRNIRDTIMQGRENTPMPSWSVRFAGPMNDQQIQDLIAYLVSIQDVPEKDNLCINPGAAEEEEPVPAPTASPTPETEAA